MTHEVGLMRSWATPDARTRSVVLFSLLLTAYALRLTEVAVMGSTHQPDEVFQTLEPAHRLWTGQGVVTWEWRDGIRSWLLPAFIAGVMKVFGAISVSPRVYLAGVYSVFAASSLLIVYVGFRVGERFQGLSGAFVVGGSCVVWPDLVYFGARTLTEAVAAPLLALAAYLALFIPSAESEARRRVFWIGLILGLIFVLRFHLSLALLVIAVSACRTHVRQRWLVLIAGAAIPVGAGGLLDWITLGTPFQAVWKNVWANIIEGRSSEFGVQRRLFFPLESFHELGLAILPILIFLIVGARRIPLFVACAAAVWLTFSLIPH
ncbi:MAG: mannosyltransferase [Hyphomicrobiales bacterium]|nr:mannosyltransferase [Hyphomicrobiales bacterium]